jgi:hypothetical protein
VVIDSQAGDEGTREANQRQRVALMENSKLQYIREGFGDVNQEKNHNLNIHETVHFSGVKCIMLEDIGTIILRGKIQSRLCKKCCFNPIVASMLSCGRRVYLKLAVNIFAYMN